ncbi:hypothetical protein [Flavobacterium caeni]|uniref:hypothetical protein n=1 Tax=Flavobacterium caeni TaxID=490189 RepID=UPI001113175E|nr:hypothetical protein [Flavobacterium caeni]
MITAKKFTPRILPQRKQRFRKERKACQRCEKLRILCDKSTAKERRSSKYRRFNHKAHRGFAKCAKLKSLYALRKHLVHWVSNNRKEEEEGKDHQVILCENAAHFAVKKSTAKQITSRKCPVKTFANFAKNTADFAVKNQQQNK